LHYILCKCQKQFIEAVLKCSLGSILNLHFYILWLIGSSQQLQRLDVAEVDILSSRVKVSYAASDLGIIINSQLTMSAHVSAVCQSGFNQLPQLRPPIRSSSTEATKMLVEAFVSWRLDYCNSLLDGITDRLMQRVQSV